MDKAKVFFTPVAVSVFIVFLLYQFCGIRVPDIASMFFIQTLGFGLAVGNAVQKSSAYFRAAVIPVILGFVIFCGLFGIHPGEIVIAGKSLPLQAWLSIALGISVGFTMGKGGL